MEIWKSPTWSIWWWTVQLHYLCWVLYKLPKSDLWLTSALTLPKSFPCNSGWADLSMQACGLVMWVMDQLVWFGVGWTSLTLSMSLIIWWPSPSPTGSSLQKSLVAARASTLRTTHGCFHARASWSRRAQGLMAFPAPSAGSSSHCRSAGRRGTGSALGCSSRGQVFAVGTSSGINLDRCNKASSKASWPDTFPTGQVPCRCLKRKDEICSSFERDYFKSASNTQSLYTKGYK